MLNDPANLTGYLVQQFIKLSRRQFMKPVVQKVSDSIPVLQKLERKLTPNVYTQTAQSGRTPGRHLALVTGYFSHNEGRATFGDMEVMKVVLAWLDGLGIPYDLAGSKGNGVHGLNLETLNPEPYTIFVFACGPWVDRNNPMLSRFDHCLKIGVNLSIEAGTTHTFDVLLARDLPDRQNADLLFASKQPPRPLAGVILVHAQREYGDRQRHERAEEAIAAYLHRGEVAALPLDTTVINNPSRIGTAVQLESVMRRLDVVITTRLHGMVFALKNGIPVVAIDAIAGGAKVTKQAKAVGWPLVFDGETVTEQQIKEAVDRCLRGEFRDVLAQVAMRADQSVSAARSVFADAISSLPVPEESGRDARRPVPRA